MSGQCYSPWSLRRTIKELKSELYWGKPLPFIESYLLTLKFYFTCNDAGFQLNVSLSYRTQSDTIYKVFPASQFLSSLDIPDYIRYVSADKITTDKAFKIELPKVTYWLGWWFALSRISYNKTIAHHYERAYVTSNGLQYLTCTSRHLSWFESLMSTQWPRRTRLESSTKDLSR